MVQSISTVWFSVKVAGFLLFDLLYFHMDQNRTPKTIIPIATTTKNIAICSPKTSLLISVTPTGIFTSNQSADIKSDIG